MLKGWFSNRPPDLALALGLVPVLKKLRPSGVLQSLDIRLRQAADDNLSSIEFLYRLLVDEVERRDAKQLLIVDDLGLRPLTNDEPMDLYEIIRQRYEHISTIVTSYRDVTEWYPLFGDALLASAAMDRLLHHCEILVLDGKSYCTARKAA